MKTKYFKLLGCAALSFMCAMVSHAQSVSSTPVGYVSLTINGGGFTSLSNPLENPVVYSGTASSVSGSTITTSFALTDSELANLDPNGDSSHYVQTTDGIILNIIANTATTITVDSDVSLLVSTDDAITIKKHSTIGDLFSTDNSIGLTSGTSVTASDIVYIMGGDGSGSYDIYYYQTDPSPSFINAFGGSGWRGISSTSVDMASVVIGPDDGVIVKRDAATDISFIVTGTVNINDHRRDLPAGFSLVSYPFPVTTTLDDSGIFSSTNGYVSSTNISASDVVYVLSPDGNFSLYYYQTDPSPSFINAFGGSGWRTASDNITDVGSSPIPAGSSLIIYHRGGGLAWTEALPYTL
jgi:hypothetical protein